MSSEITFIDYDPTNSVRSYTTSRWNGRMITALLEDTSIYNIFSLGWQLGAPATRAGSRNCLQGLSGLLQISKLDIYEGLSYGS